MSTASPLPLQPLPPDLVSDAEARALKHQVAQRLLEHRRRRTHGVDAQTPLPLEVPVAPRHNRIAESVAAQYARKASYRDLLEQEAEAAVRRAEAAAEVARRNAEAVAAAQQQLLEEMEAWTAPVPSQSGPAEVLPFAASIEAAEVAVLSSEAPELASAAVPIAAPAQPPVVNVAASVLAQPEPVEFYPPEPLEPALPLPTNLIEFPRQLVAPRRARPRLAEGPLREEGGAERAQLRIFEVEASALSTEPPAESVLPEWHTIRLESQTEPRPVENPDAQTSFALPLYVAPLSLRVMAATVDACCIGSALLLAIAVAAYASPVLPTGIPAALSVMGTLAIFTVFYLVLFFALSDATPGMRYARIALCTFTDENPTRKEQLRRILALALASMPLGLGVLWTCLDEDGLGWHDRISRMYPRAY